MIEIAHPQAAMTVLGDREAPPNGMAGIHIDVPDLDGKDFAPQVGVDGEPVLYGFGRALIPVTPGRHVVEAQKLRGQDGTFALTIRAGEVARIVCERGRFRVEGTPPARRVPPMVRMAPLIVGGVLALTALLLGLVFLLHLTGLPDGLVVALAAVPGTAGLVWFMFRTGQAYDAMFSPTWNQNRSSRSGPAHSPLRLGDDAAVPTPPAGRGAVLLELRFHASAVDADGVEDFDYDGWVAAPTVRIDGRTVVAGWGRCWYPLSPGLHDVELTEPATAKTRVEVTAGGISTLRCQATVIHQGVSTATLAPG
ncbi:hypothetical protein [Actinoplanes sp. NPDC051851]|uniref:hypothetical protein n=1 Tax=Actinoplanes sp. NPDC051851 TaxID=3154753 RepID=UPI00343B471D